VLRLIETILAEKHASWIKRKKYLDITACLKEFEEEEIKKYG